MNAFTSLVSRGFRLITVAALGVALSAQAGQVILGGSAQSGLQQALNALSVSYSVSGANTPSAAGLGAGDTIVIGMDGGTQSFLDYTSFLNAGGRVIVAGGSNYQPYRDWVSLYFNITHTSQGWHTDGAWSTAAAIPVTAGLPSTYTFQNNNATYHMLGFLATPDTVLYGKNGENQYVAALRNYANGGSFNYMALDLSQYPSPADLTNFTIPWLANSLNYSSAPVSAPDSGAGFSLFFAALAGSAVLARRRTA